MKTLNVVTLFFLVFSAGAAHAQKSKFTTNEERFIYTLINSYFTNDAEAYFALTQRFSSHQFQNVSEVVSQMNERRLPKDIVLETEYGDVPTSIQLVRESVDKIELIRIDSLDAPGARLYNVAAWITREYQVLTSPLIMRQVVAHKVYVVFRGDMPENFADFEATMFEELVEGYIL